MTPHGVGGLRLDLPADDRAIRARHVEAHDDVRLFLFHIADHTRKRHVMGRVVVHRHCVVGRQRGGQCEYECDCTGKSFHHETEGYAAQLPPGSLTVSHTGQ